MDSQFLKQSSTVGLALIAAALIIIAMQRFALANENPRSKSQAFTASEYVTVDRLLSTNELEVLRSRKIRVVRAHSNADSRTFDDPKSLRSLRSVRLESLNNSALLKGLSRNHTQIDDLTIVQKQPLTDDDITCLRNFDRLQILQLLCPVNNAKLFAAMLPRSLEWLTLDHTDLPEGTDVAEYNLPNLDRINLWGDDINLAFFDHITAPRLHDVNFSQGHVDFSKAKIQQGVLASLGKFKHLETINFQECEYDEADLQALKNQKSHLYITEPDKDFRHNRQTGKWEQFNRQTGEWDEYYKWNQQTRKWEAVAPKSDKVATNAVGYDQNALGYDPRALSIDGPLSKEDILKISANECPPIHTKDGSPADLFDAPKVFSHVKDMTLQSTNNGSQLHALAKNYSNVLFLRIIQKEALSDDQLLAIGRFKHLMTLDLNCPIPNSKLFAEAIPSTILMMRLNKTGLATNSNGADLNLPKLIGLQISDDTVSGGLFDHLNAPELNNLSVIRSDIAAGVLKEWRKFRKLTSIDLIGSKFDRSEIEELRKAFPKAQISGP